MSFQRHFDRSTQSAIWSAVALWVLVGCGSGPARTSVSGKVTFDGQPVATGQIAFEPLSGGRLGIAQIVDGAYLMPAQQGPTTGNYVVRITGHRPTGRKAKASRVADGQALAEQYEQFIPAKYNEQSGLKTEIGAEGEVVRDFALTSK